MNYCLIPDDSAAFWEFLSGLPLPAGVLQALRKSTIEKVEIQEEPPQWRVYVKTVLPISEAALQPVAEFPADTTLPRLPEAAQSQQTRLVPQVPCPREPAAACR